MLTQPGRTYTDLILGTEPNAAYRIFEEHSEAIEWVSEDREPGDLTRRLYRIVRLEVGDALVVETPAPRLVPWPPSAGGIAG